jgi:DNA-binding transcriptional ArsR family regulator
LVAGKVALGEKQPATVDLPTEAQVALAAETMQLLGDPTRIKVLWALLQGEQSVGRLAELVGAQPASVSQHLAKLRLGRLVELRREGTFTFYRSSNVHIRQLLEEVLFHADHIVQGLPDHEGTR